MHGYSLHSLVTLPAAVLIQRTAALLHGYKHASPNSMLCTPWDVTNVYNRIALSMYDWILLLYCFASDIHFCVTYNNMQDFHFKWTTKTGSFSDKLWKTMVYC